MMVVVVLLLSVKVWKELLNIEPCIQCRMVCKIRNTTQRWQRTVAVNSSVELKWVRPAIHLPPFHPKIRTASLITSKLTDVYVKMLVHRHPNLLVRIMHTINCVRYRSTGTFSILWPDWPYPKMPLDPFFNTNFCCLSLRRDDLVCVLSKYIQAVPIRANSFQNTYKSEIWQLLILDVRFN